MEPDIIKIIEKLKNRAADFGGKETDYIFRNNTKLDSITGSKGNYFGWINPEEPPNGAYEDLSLVVFPAYEKGKPWIVALGVGSAGFKNDIQLASKPGTRRLFSKIVGENGFIKSDFTDLKTKLTKLTKDDNLAHLKATLERYSNVLPAARIVEDPDSDEGFSILEGFLAAYARIRQWPSTKNQIKLVDSILSRFESSNVEDDVLIKNLLRERKYIVLQGAPGTGKTYSAKSIANEENYKTFFTQFHAETTYSDFIYGIRPSLNSDMIKYEEHIGVFNNAVKWAEEHPEESTLLIIDEINRANLSSVLGPIFYLFEYQAGERNLELELYPGKTITELPHNFYVIATMNTADRSLAVVDFALRRRFAWYTLKPKKLDIINFHKSDFDRISNIFTEYANHHELNLQPGQAYFIANEEQMKDRIKYELYPLIREYIEEGLLIDAREEFNTYFLERINTPLFE